MSVNPWRELERELNPKQREAVFATAPHCLVLAGPGTGKTRTLVNRIIYLVTVLGEDPGGVLPLTFTRKAARVMVGRLACYLGQDASSIRAGTFHHFGLQLLRAHAGRGEIPADFGVADEQRQVRTLQRAWNRLGFSTREAEEKELRMLLGRFGAYRLDRDPDLLSKLQVELFDEYQRLLRDESALDFDDILDLTRRLLEEDENLLAKTRRSWPRVLVDEFQDTDALQYRILRHLVPADGSSFLVADDQQSIYAWRGADRRNIAEYRRDYGPLEIVLDENYRNTARILTSAQALIAAGGEAKRALVSRAEGDGSLEYESFPGEKEEAEFLAADIRRARATDPGLRWRDIAVLYPKHAIGEYLETRLMGERIPVELVAGRALLEQGRIRQLIAFLRILRNGNDEDALETLLAASLDDGSFALLRASARLRGDSIRAAVDLLIRSRNTLRGRSRRWESFLGENAALADEVWLGAWRSRFPSGLGLEDFLPPAGVAEGQAAEPPAGSEEPDARALRRDCEAQGQRLQILARLPWLLESLVARISNLRAGGAGRTLSQLVREVLLELADDEEQSLPGDPAEIDGLAELLSELRERLRLGRRVGVAADTDAGSEILTALLRQGLEPWLAQNLVAGEPGPPPASTLRVDGRHGELRLGGDPDRVVRGAPAALLVFRLYQLWRADEHRSLNDYVVFDLETTGVDITGCEIVEIAGIRYESGREVERFATLVRPAAPIPPGATAIHGIDDAMVADAPPPAQALRDFLRFAGERDLVAHNGAGFDFPILRRLAREHGLARPANALFDTLALARRLFPGERVRLEDLIARFGIRAEARHRALDDCRCLGEAFERMQALHLGRLRRRVGQEALAPAALALYLDPAAVPKRDRGGRDFELFRRGVRRLLASGSDWLTRFAKPEERGAMEEGLLAAAGLTAEAPELFTGLHSEEERFLALVPRFDELYLGDSLASFLDFLALYQPPDLTQELDAVQLMTIHSAKGLEFRRVYIAGLEENVLPGYYALRAEDPEAIAEERRLLYVAMTRAAESLTLTQVENRGGFQQEPSRFLKHLSAEGEA